MTTITRKQFLNEFSESGINVNDLTPQTKATLKNAGVSEAELAKLAGKDGRITGEEEFKKLFKIIDSFEKKGDPDSFYIKTPGEVGVETQSGAVYQALKSEVDRNRAKASSMGIIHLGMRPASSKEADELSKANPTANGGVVRIEAYKVEGEITHNGKTFDLKKDAGLKDFRDSLSNGPDKMPKAQAQKFVDFLKTQNVKTRDELAQLGLAFFKTGENKLPVNRLVISGHGALGDIWGDKEGELFQLKDVQKLGAIFPKGAEKIEHVAVAACFCAGEDTFETLRSTFPNLKSSFAYNWFSPKAGKGAEAHLKKWESLTDGDDPGQVDPPFQKTATWNIADGTQGLPKMPLYMAHAKAQEMEHAYEAYKSGNKKPAAPGGTTNDRALDEYYMRLVDLSRHPEITAQLKAEVEERRKEVLKLRYP